MAVGKLLAAGLLALATTMAQGPAPAQAQDQEQGDGLRVADRAAVLNTVLDRRSRRGRGLIAGVVQFLNAGASIGFLGVNNVLDAVGLGFVTIPSPSDTTRRTFEQLARETVRSTGRIWGEIFAAEGRLYVPPQLVLYDSRLRTACGDIRPGRPPVYCTNDRRIYLDLAFLNQLEQDFAGDSQRLDFAPAFVLAHEVGHHVQKLRGDTDRLFGPARAEQTEPASRIEVRLELQADCFAGLWAKRVGANYSRITERDLQEALAVVQGFADAPNTDAEGGDGSISEGTMTHGSPEQRAKWVQIGYDSGALDACDTFSVPFSEL